MAWRVGTCGWQYRDWRGRLYPPGLPQRAWLERYATRFDTVEVDASFYRLPERSSFERWAASVPDGFTFATKASRYLTHVRRLAEPEEPVGRLLERAAGLGDRMGPVLVQLPPNMRADLGRLDATLAAFPPSVRVAVEPRHDTWDTPALDRLLERRGSALVLADRLGPLGRWRSTAPWGYVRFHGGRATPPGAYGSVALASAARRLADCFPEGAEVFVYFNNDHLGAAVDNAGSFARMSP